ncbi:MAG TPA: PBP1A family penicillin-binding protein [Blastocatellia bacterium]|nr:PBP1A family penicillin-binding protein [Blastocatellia bacterium]
MATVTKKPRTRVIRKEERRAGLLGRIARRLFTRKVLIALGVLSLVAVAVTVFFYVKYSIMIDTWRQGDIIVRTTGIYAAPRSIRVGQALSLDQLKGHLDSIGYVESSKEADSKRGRYLIKNGSIEIHTSLDSKINNAPQFPNIIVSFGGNGRAITKITSIDSKRNLDTALIEPEMVTAFSNDKQRQKQKLVSFKDLPKHYKDAVVAIEDRQFFEHSGINFRGIVRAVWRDASEGELQQGGSSITQQLVKNFFLTPERTFKRKSQEMMIALVLETKLTKAEIFELYANDVYMGQSGSYSINGVGEAASVYFNKDVVNLTLPEAAFLAGIIRGPSLYSPYRDPERAKARRNQVLDSMFEAGFIDEATARQAKATELKIEPKRRAVNSDAPYFIDYLQQQLLSESATRDLSQQSFRVYSTVDMDLQRAADKAVGDTLAKLDPIFSKRKKNPVPPGTLQAALVALNAKTGEIVAMVGGRDYGQSQLNRAIDANRQPGSVFKPIVYATAINTAYEDSSDDIITPANMFLDAPETFYYGGSKTYSPDNFGKAYSNRDVTMRDGLVHSLNVVTVRIAEKVGYGKVARMAEKLGLPRPQPFPALALGTAEATPLEIAQAYTAFANNGYLATARPIKRISNSEGVSIIETRAETRPALKPGVSWLMTNMMQDVLNKGTAARARAMGFTATAAGKTGTSRDGWFAGYTPNLVCVVWVGFDDNSELGLEGSQSALPIWAAFMKQALALRPDLGGDSFPKPDGIVSAEIDPTTGELATESCPTRRTEYFVEGTQPVDSCEAHAGGLPFEAPLPPPGDQPLQPPKDPPERIPPAAREPERPTEQTRPRSAPRRP